MSGPTAELKASDDVPGRCPACGHQLAELERGRCPLCDYVLVDEPVTDRDQTPYAESQPYGRRAWWTMCKWIWAAGAGRLGHLGLMQSSPASKHFARINLLLMALTASICCLALFGWHSVRIVPGAVDKVRLTPSGQGWYQVAVLAEESSGRRNGTGRIVAWWWNPPQAMIGSVVGLVTSLILLAVLMAFLRGGVERSLRQRYRRQERLAASLAYATAWGLPLIPAGAILSLLPICRVSVLAKWPVQLSETFVYGPAAVIAALAVFAWWFGLLRLAATVPVPSRRTVGLFCGLCMPLIAMTLIGAVVWGLLSLQDVGSPALNLQW